MNYLDYKPKIDKALLDEFSIKHPLSSALYILGIFLGIVLTAWAVYALPSLPVFVIAFIVIGIFQHHLLIIQHEALHFFLFNSRALNNLVGYFVSYLIGFTMKYRKHHFSHHRKLGQTGDPDYDNYRKASMSRYDVVKALFFNLTGIAAVRQFLSQSKQETAVSGSAKKRFDFEVFGIVAVQAALLLLNYYLGHWEYYFLLWLLPLVTLTKTLTNFRNLAEHILRKECDDGNFEKTRLRTILCGPIEQFLFAPMNFNYHAEHHLFLSVPYQNLPKLHQRLREAPEYPIYVDLQKGYIATVLKHTA